MKKIKKDFEQRFKFLVTEYNFTLQSYLIKDWGCQFLYLNKIKNVGVKIVYEYRESYVSIMLYRLINGELKEDTRNIKQSTVLNSFSLDDIVNLENPTALIKPAYKYPSNCIFFDEKEGLYNYLKGFSDNLKKYGKDVLEGNFDIFPKLDKIVKLRVISNEIE